MKARLLTIGRPARWVMLTIFVSSCSFTAIQQIALNADLVQSPDFGAGLLDATSSGVSILLAARILQALALQAMAVFSLIEAREKLFNVPARLVVAFGALFEMKAAAQAIQAWGMFHNVWRARDFVNCMEVVTETLIVAFIIMAKAHRRKGDG